MSFDAFERLSVEQLRALGGSKWTTYPTALGTFIAESDFGTAPAVLDAVRERVDAAAFGYSTKAERSSVGDALAGWTRDRFGWEIDPATVGVLPEVLTALELTVDHYTRPGSAVVVPTPTYMPFFTLLRDHGRQIVEVPLLRAGAARWGFDYDAIDAAFAAGAGLLVLVNPANPTGTSFTREDLLPLVEIVERHGGRVWADEIHAPLLFDDRRHVPYASLGEAAASHTITATSASKGWNIPGLKCSQIVFTNPDDARAWRQVGRWPSHTVGYLGVFATVASYAHGREWLDELVAHLQTTRDLLGSLVAERLPRARYTAPEATYLAWLDLRDYFPVDEGRAIESVASYFLREAGVAGTDGRLCGRDFRGFFRINFATPRPVLDEIVSRLAAALPA